MSPINREEALNILKLKTFEALLPYFQQATLVRQLLAHDTIKTCAIVNAKCGACGENCAFCPQSVYSQSKIQTYPMMNVDEIFTAAEKAQQMGASNFGIVTSGRTISSEEEMKTLERVIQKIRCELNITPCGSLGILTYEQLLRLKNAGMGRYHHNLESSRSFYPTICTTRTYEDQLRTIRDAKRAGLKICSGGIFGMGESDEQRVEMFETLSEEGVDSVPINFLHPQAGTQKAHITPPSPLTCLKIITVARLMLPHARIRLCGGREFNLRDMQSWIFAAGADTVMIGNYLVTAGRTFEQDLKMFEDAGMKVIFEEE